MTRNKNMVNYNSISSKTREPLIQNKQISMIDSNKISIYLFIEYTNYRFNNNI